MARISRAKRQQISTAATLFLQSNGWFHNRTAPIPTQKLLRAFGHFAGVPVVLFQNENKWQCLERLCRQNGVEIIKEKTAPRTRSAKQEQVALNPNSDSFLSSFEWRKVRMMALKKHGAICQCCGASPKDGITVNVDHIKPRRIYPELALDLNNLQVLCGACNHGKGNWDMTDWRTKETAAH